MHHQPCATMPPSSAVLLFPPQLMHNHRYQNLQNNHMARLNERTYTSETCLVLEGVQSGAGLLHYTPHEM